jgi:CheY-like chemotaxis protein
MSGVTLPVTRPAGRALLVGSIGCRTEPRDRLSERGFQCAEADDPYAAAVELSKRASAYQCVVLSLQSLYREELSLISTIKQRWPHLDVWLTQTTGREAAMADAMRLGADGLLTEEGLHRTAPPPMAIFRSADEPPTHHPGTDEPPAATEDMAGEPVLTADELRALLQDPPSRKGDST